MAVKTITDFVSTVTLSIFHNERGENDFAQMFAGPQNIRIAGGFGASLHNTLMHRPEFVHMIALIRTAAGIHKRKHPRDQQRRLVVSNAVGAGENCAGFAVEAGAVGEEDGVFCGVLFA